MLNVIGFDGMRIDLYQTITVSPYQDYEVANWWAHNGPPGNCAGRLYYNARTLGPFILIPQTYEVAIHTLQPTTSVGTIQMRLTYTSGATISDDMYVQYTVFLDDVSATLATTTF